MLICDRVSVAPLNGFRYLSNNFAGLKSFHQPASSSPLSQQEIGPLIKSDFNNTNWTQNAHVSLSIIVSNVDKIY